MSEWRPLTKLQELERRKDMADSKSDGAMSLIWGLAAAVSYIAHLRWDNNWYTVGAYIGVMLVIPWCLGHECRLADAAYNAELDKRHER